MTGPEDGDRTDDRLATWLSAYDEAVASGGQALAPGEDEVPPELRNRLRRAKECVDLLNDSWSRSGLNALTTDPFGLPQSHLAEAGTAAIPGAAAGPYRRSPLRDDEASGFRLPGFQVLEKVGQGGMGVVYRAIQLSLNREVAVKVLPPHLADDVSRLRRFRNEAQVAASLVDSGILPVFDILEVGGVPLLVMPYIDGSDLGKVIVDRRATIRGEPDVEAKRHPWAALSNADYLARVFPVIDRLVEAVAVIHQANVIHRDLKPSNVLMDRRGNVWLTDFGLAKLGDGATLTNVGAQLGSPGYMSPEQWEASDDLNSRADVFGLGVTIYQALTLQLPYGPSKIDRRTPLPAAPRKKQSVLRSDHDVVILKALEPDRQDRYASGVELRDDWRRVRNGEFPKARKVGRARRLGRRVRNHPWGVSDAVMVAIMLGLLGLGLRGRGPRPQQAPAPAGPVVATRTVIVNTNPPGARVALARLRPETGEYETDRIIRPAAGGTTPVTLPNVPVGDYLVVAEIERFQRFHEVFRHVPSADDDKKADQSLVYKHYDWSERQDGAVVLPTIALHRAPDVTKAMTRFEGSSDFLMGEKDPRIGLPTHPAQVDPFLLDTHEVTVGSYVDVIGALPTTLESASALLRPENAVVHVTHEQALAYAELVGKRLPTEEEYEFAATLGGRHRFPWGDGEEPMRPDGTSWRWSFGVVGRSDDFDRTDTSPPVLGLFSNVAEWTSSPFKPYLKGKIPRILEGAWVIRGGSPSVLQGKQPVRREIVSPRMRMSEQPVRSLPGLGFRCARSERPRFLDGP
jgi:eukaryotic-like serine/threonine-protein kinase